MLAYHPFRTRSKSSPSRPQQSVKTDPQPNSQLCEPSGRPGPHELCNKLTPPLPLLPDPPPTHSSPLRTLRERLKRPSSAGGPGESRELKGMPLQEGSAHVSRKPSRLTKSRPSTASGVPERRLPEAMDVRFSLSNVQKSNGDLSLARPHTRRSHVPHAMKGVSGTGTPHTTMAKDDRPGGVKTRAQRPMAPLPSPRQLIDATKFPPNYLCPSVADRTILCEPPSKMQAQECQFQLKNGKKHHKYDAKVVPYPVSYEQSIIDYAFWDEMWHQSCYKGTMICHPLKKVPQRILDLGCGAGCFIIDAAKHWKDAQFVGLDIVPIQPDLHQLGRSDIANRITWLQANFLERLPFQDNEFDLVIAKRIARGVPENKWDSLLEEVYRVLKPGGMFELIEEELFFPGKPVYTRTQTLVDLDVVVSSPQSSTTFVPDSSSSSYSLTPPTSLSSHRPSTDRYITPTQTSIIPGSGTLPIEIPTPLSPQQSYIPMKSPPHPLGMEDAERILFPYPEGSPPPPPKQPIDPRDHSLLEFIYNEMHASRFINLQPLALLKNSLSLYFEEACIHPPTTFTFPPRPAPSPGHSSRPTVPSSKTAKSGELPVNPKPVLEPSVLALLSSPKPCILVDDDRFNPFVGKPNSQSVLDTAQHTVHEHSCPKEEPGRSPFLQTSANGSVSQVLAIRVREGYSKRCRRPLNSLHFDPRVLNMLLASKVREVVGCAEEMWAWVVEYKRRADKRKADPAHESREDAALFARAKPHRERLVQMERKEFDEVLLWFELDMQEQIGLDSIVHSQLGWTQGIAARTPARKEFEQLCEEWALHQQSQSSISLGGNESGGMSTHEHTPPLSSLEPWERIGRKMTVAVAWKVDGRRRDGGR